MGNSTEISWADSTLNPWVGCTKVSAACDNCYAEALMDKRMHKVEWGAGKPRVRTSAANWKLPERWNAGGFAECIECGWRGSHNQLQYIGMVPWERTPQCPECNETAGIDMRARRRVFCASLADWLDNEAPIEWLVDLLDLIRRTPNLDWLLLTKRIGNWRVRINAALNASNDVALREWIALWLAGNAPRNVWLGATVINQAEADRDVPKLLAVPARVRFLSIEPMLGAMDLSQHLWGRAQPCGSCPKDADCECGYYARHTIDGESALHWIICGGESGPHARPMQNEWAQSLVDQSRAAGVAVFVKQLSSGGSKPLKDLLDFPATLRAREFPNA